jgi:hypothetical protein
MKSKSSASTFYLPPHSQTVISRDLLTALSDDETPSPPKGVKKMPKSVEQVANQMRDREWKQKRQQREGIASAKRAANREAKRREGKMKTL